jgi:hypothetical protein
MWLTWSRAVAFSEKHHSRTGPAAPAAGIIPAAAAIGLCSAVRTSCKTYCQKALIVQLMLMQGLISYSHLSPAWPYGSLKKRP